MAQRPERVMATKVYDPNNVHCKNSVLPPLKDSNNLSPYTNAQTKGTLNGNILIKPPKDAAKKKTPYNGEIQKATPPIGFVTRNEMISRMKNRASKPDGIKLDKPINTESKKGIPKGFVTREEMEVKCFFRKMNNPSEKHPDLSASPLNTAKNRTDTNKPPPKPRLVKPQQEKSKLSANINNSTKIRQSENASQDNPLSNNNTSVKVEPKHEEPADLRAKLDSNEHAVIGDGHTVIEVGDISSSTIESEFILTGRNTSTAITRQTEQKPISLDKNAAPILKILVMNVNGDPDKLESIPKRRRQAIQEVVLKHEPDLVLFQEFSWAKINNATWNDTPLPEHFEYIRHQDASIMYCADKITIVRDIDTDLRSILERLQRNSNNRLQRPFPNNFNPIPRMCARIVKTQTLSSVELLCISWHGPSNKKGGKGGLAEQAKVEYFEYWIEFLQNIRKKFNLPMLVAGDYNVKIDSIAHLVQSPFKICRYKASARRTRKGVIDYCMVTEDLELNGMTWVNLENDTDVTNVNILLDHDPLIATLSINTIGKLAAPLSFGKKISMPSPIIRM